MTNSLTVTLFFQIPLSSTEPIQSKGQEIEKVPEISNIDAAVNYWSPKGVDKKLCITDAQAFKNLSEEFKRSYNLVICCSKYEKKIHKIPQNTPEAFVIPCSVRNGKLNFSVSFTALIFYIQLKYKFPQEHIEIKLSREKHQNLIEIFNNVKCQFQEIKEEICSKLDNKAKATDHPNDTLKIVVINDTDNTEVLLEDKVLDSLKQKNSYIVSVKTDCTSNGFERIHDHKHERLATFKCKPWGKDTADYYCIALAILFQLETKLDPIIVSKDKGFSLHNDAFGHCQVLNNDKASDIWKNINEYFSFKASDKASDIWKKIKKHFWIGLLGILITLSMLIWIK